MIFSRCRTLLSLSLLIFVIWIQPVGAQPTSVRDINLLPQSSSPSQFVAIGNVVYFAADTGVHGRELWRSDGMAAGTVLVKDIWPSSQPDRGGPSDLTNVNGVLYFEASMASTSTAMSYGAVPGRRRARSWSRTSGLAVTVLVLPTSPTSTGCCILWRIMVSTAGSYGGLLRRCPAMKGTGMGDGVNG